MAGNNWYLKAIRRLKEGRFDFRSSTPQQYKLLMVKTGSTAGTDLITPEFVADIATLAEYDGTNYARQVLSLTSPAVNGAQSRVETLIANAVFTALGPSAGVSQGIGCVIFEQKTNDADSPLVSFYDGGGFPMVGSGTNFTVQFNAAGGLAIKLGTL